MNREEETKQEWLVVGLGNPGRKYSGTRHNVGFMLVQEIADQTQMTLKEESKWPGFAVRFQQSGGVFHLFLPTAYMNRSGTAVVRYLQYYKIEPVNMVVISDDLDLLLGELRFRTTGGAGGHNGLKSIISELGTADFNRLRVGIGRQPFGETADYVLQEFTAMEKEQLQPSLRFAAETLLSLPSHPLDRFIQTINSFRKKSLKDHNSQGCAGEKI